MKVAYPFLESMLMFRYSQILNYMFIIYFLVLVLSGQIRRLWVLWTSCWFAFFFLTSIFISLLFSFLFETVADKKLNKYFFFFWKCVCILVNVSIYFLHYLNFCSELPGVNISSWFIFICLSRKSVVVARSVSNTTSLIEVTNSFC